MKKFGFGKKKDDDGEDSNRSALFGSRSKNPSPAPAISNPYAQPPQAADPYAQDSKSAGNPYAKAAPYNAGGLPSGPGANRGVPGPAPQRGYGAPPAAAPQNGGGYGAEKYGNVGGYGANRYEGSSSSSGGASRYGPGGYGGLGRSNSNETTNTDANRDALFGDAKDRFASNPRAPPPYEEGGSGAAGGYGEGGYGAERQLTAEEEEEEDIQATKQQIRFMKQEDIASTRNALRIAAQAEETGRATLARLGAQGERIHNTEKHLDLAANHNRIAEEKAKELKQLNKSMFAVHVSNPFTASSRRAQRDEDIINKHRTEREQREKTRSEAYGSKARMDGNLRESAAEQVRSKQPTKASLAERSKYQFEADSEDDEMENEIEANIDALGGAASRLNQLAKATGKEIDEQNRHIDRIIDKGTHVDDQIAMNRARLDRIH